MFKGVNMDVTILANELVEVLAPFLPFLTQFTRETAERAGREFGAEAWEHARLLWDRLAGRLEERPAAAETVRDAAEAPDDDDARAALRLQIRKLLADDGELANELRRLLDERPGAAESSVTVIASGERSIAVGRDARRSRLETGDRTADPD
jgi:hypothetical protein